MQCNRGTLKRPLRDIIKSIGRAENSTQRPCQHPTQFPHGYTSCRAAGTAIVSSTCRSGRNQISQNAVGAAVRSYAAVAEEQQDGEAAAAVEDALRGSQTAWTSESRHKDPSIVASTTAIDAYMPFPVVDTGTIEPRLRDGADYSANYFKQQLYRHYGDIDKAAKRVSRHKQQSPDAWKRMLHMLDQATPTREGHYKRVSEVVTLPAGVAAVFRPNKEMAILEIMQRTGCHLQMRSSYAVEGRSDAFTGLVLQGNVSQNSSALNFLPRYIEVSFIDTAEKRSRLKRDELHRQIETGNAGDLGRDYRSGTDEHEPDGAANATHADNGLIRSVWSTAREKRDLQPRHLPRTRPNLETVPDFTAYVTDLTSTEHKVLYDLDSDGSVRLDIPVVVKELISLFTNPATSRLSGDLSTSHALRYLAKHERLDAIRRISKALNEAGRILGQRSFDALLSAASLNGDWFNFELVLRTMRRHRIPGPMVWARFHSLVFEHVPHEADTVISLMRKRGLLDDNVALLTIIRSRIRKELTAYLRDMGAVDGFLEMYDEKVAREFGRPDYNWLTVDALNGMLHVLLSLGKTNEAATLMEQFRKRGTEPPNTASLNTFLSPALVNTDAGSAIATLKMFHVGRPGALAPNEITYQSLFMIAWHRKYYNMLRVIWRYACVAAQASQDLRHRLLTSLLSYSPTEAEDVNRSRLFKAWAGKFVVGVARDLVPGSYVPYDTSPTRPLSDDERSLADLSLQPRLEKNTADSLKRRREMKSLMKKDLQEAGQCKPLLPLTVVLERAWQKDVRWQEAGLGHPDKALAKDVERAMFEEILLRGIRVPMRPGDCTALRKWEIPWLLQRELQAAARSAEVKAQQDSSVSSE
ncbi:hypothetical protein CKM354_000614400 [Cercospora kikuchii]|uniref:Pentatricopeptide repeat domain-containing protein n=1 Tax=Cercospora kikuchii TaxID=84275 RepID=A0A9P3CHK9_9PEZI|nr:uncharacterized protein CKM354_000614400 [Cercospora kikuchii]GIZ42896.1 hypothetical protein CKM354_000614400 [Cercospora kikuchii]